MNISIIIPTFNGKNLLEKNLPFVTNAANNYHEGVVEIIIVDDFSSDDSVSFLQNNYSRIKIIKNNEHSGFAKNCNLGVEKSTGEIIILLNNDVSPEKDFLEPLITHFSDPLVFAVGCLEKSFQNGHEILSGKSIGYFKKGLVWHDRAPDQLTAGVTFWVAGGSGAFCKTIWEKLNGFDESYKPFYWEDIDLSYRAQKTGHKVIFEPKSIVVHNHESTIGKIYDQGDIKVFSVKNQFLFFWKNITDFKMRLLHLIWFPFWFIMSLLGKFYIIKGIFLGFKDFNFSHSNKTSPRLSDQDILDQFI